MNFFSESLDDGENKISWVIPQLWGSVNHSRPRPCLAFSWVFFSRKGSTGWGWHPYLKYSSGLHTWVHKYFTPLWCADAMGCRFPVTDMSLASGVGVVMVSLSDKEHCTIFCIFFLSLSLGQHVSHHSTVYFLLAHLYVWLVMSVLWRRLSHVKNLDCAVILCFLFYFSFHWNTRSWFPPQTCKYRFSS